MLPLWAIALALAAVPTAIAQSEPTITAVDSGGEPSYRFEPATLRLGLAAEFRVVGGTTEPHTLTHDAPVNDRRFDSGNVPAGGSTTMRAPNEAGTFAFKCLYHPGMTGTLVVQSSATTTTTNGGTPPATGLPGPGAALVALALGGAALLAARRRS